jgi:hypothetical protein
VHLLLLLLLDHVYVMRQVIEIIPVREKLDACLHILFVDRR